mmetsp:Transcript_26918/g.86468  ORF Transcript_26918/g.86468 Transcript_26918/m.86468 type:complete len:217 (-) Transcript_26918:1110-1760(-)
MLWGTASCFLFARATPRLHRTRRDAGFPPRNSSIISIPPPRYGRAQLELEPARARTAWDTDNLRSRTPLCSVAETSPRSDGATRDTLHAVAMLLRAAGWRRGAAGGGRGGRCRGREGQERGEERESPGREGGRGKVPEGGGRHMSIERCTHRLTRRLDSFRSSSEREKWRAAAAGLMCVAGSGDGSCAKSPTSCRITVAMVRSFGSAYVHMTRQRR